MNKNKSNCVCKECRENISITNKDQFPKSPNSIINSIENIRRINNKNWMDILRLAFKHAPKETKKIFQSITKNDKLINELSKEICK